MSLTCDQSLKVGVKSPCSTIINEILSTEVSNFIEFEVGLSFVILFTNLNCQALMLSISAEVVKIGRNSPANTIGERAVVK